MLSGCAVVEGDARYLVTAVGKNSEWGKIMTELDTDRPDTPLQVRIFRCVFSAPPAHASGSRASQIKLAGVAETVGKFGLAVAVACFLAQTIIWLAEMGAKVSPHPHGFLKPPHRRGTHELGVLTWAVRAQTCFEQDGQGKVTAVEICGATRAACNASAWKTHYENFHPIQINNIVSEPLSIRASRTRLRYMPVCRPRYTQSVPIMIDREQESRQQLTVSRTPAPRPPSPAPRPPLLGRSTSSSAP